MTPRADQPLLAYVWPALFVEQPGLGHMKELARALFIEASSCGRTALLPPLLASAAHCPGGSRLLAWGDYYDWADLPVAHRVLRDRTGLADLLRACPSLVIGPGEPPPADAPTLLLRHRPDPNFFEYSAPGTPPPTALLEPAFSARFPTRIRTLADEVNTRHGPFAGVLHVRRGDLAGPETEPSAVLDHLAARAAPPDAPVYLFSNERDPAWFAALRAARPRLVFEQDILPILAPATLDQDNYLRLRLGHCLQHRHDLLRLGSLRFMRNVAAPTLPPLARLRRRIRLALHRVDLAWLRPRSRVSSDQT